MWELSAKLLVLNLAARGLTTALCIVKYDITDLLQHLSNFHNYLTVGEIQHVFCIKIDMPVGVVLPEGGLRSSVFWDIPQHILVTTKTLTASKHT
jgi:hypothetical protein